MPIREPKWTEVFVDGVLYHRFQSVRDSIRFYMAHSGISNFNTAKFRVDKACRENDGYIFNLRFVKNPDYVECRPVVAINLITGDYFIKSSVGKMGEYIFGKHYYRAQTNISELCQSGKIHDATGLIFKYIENGYVTSPNTHNPDVSRPILQLNKSTGAVINYFHSVTNAALHVFNLGITKSSVRNIATFISSCANRRNPANSSPYGFKWRYVRHDEPAENVPLPEPDAVGL